MDKATIGKALRAARERAGMSVNKVAVKLGAGHERIKSLEEGKGNYGVDTLMAYAKIVGVALITVDESVVTAAPVEKKKEATPIAVPVQGEKKKKKVIIEEAD